MNLLEIKNLSKSFYLSKNWLDAISFVNGKLKFERQELKAVNNVSFNIKQGEVFCVVGESGCGKSTLARMVIGLTKPTDGQIFYKSKLTNNKILHKQMQMIFQNPYASLNPRHKILKTLSDPIRIIFPELTKNEIKEKIDEVMIQVGADPNWTSRYPHEFSGGQRQRISIARAIETNAELIIADEPVSSLDVSIQAQVLNLLLDLKKERKLTYLFITHDLSVVEHFADRVAVMYLGHLCEVADASSLFSKPKHPYSEALLSAAPKIIKNKAGIQPYIKLKSELTVSMGNTKGCPFADRCPKVMAICHQEKPKIQTIEKQRRVACHLFN